MPAVISMTMIDEHNYSSLSGFSRLWRHQRVLWWIFAVNLICGALGTVPGVLRIRGALGHSLAAEPLTTRFDVGMMVELFRLSDVSLERFTTASLLFSLVFFVFMLFVSGGVFVTYREDRRLTTGEFFGASGTYFWPFVRLLLLSIIPFVIVEMIYGTLRKAADHIGDRAIADQVGIFLSVAALIVFLLLALFVRLWFDVAKVRAVALSEPHMLRNTGRAWRLTWRGFGRLYGRYLGIAVLAWIIFAVGLVIWTYLPATATGAVFVVFELMMLAQIASRLWQLATATAWYQENPEPVPVRFVEAPSPPVLETAEAIPISETAPPVSAGEPPSLEPSTPEPASGPAPPRDPGPELPPADA